MKCLIIAGGEFNKEIINIKDDDILIAVDKGYEYCLKNNLVPDFTIGDFDSISKKVDIGSIKNCIKLNKIKNTTDTYEAIALGENKGYKNFVLYGCLGNRIEHSLANIQIIYGMALKGLDGYLVSKDKIIRVIKKGKYVFDKEEKGYLSIFSLTTKSVISLVNFKYELNNYSLTNIFPLGVDNEFIGEKSEIIVQSGYLLLVYKSKNNILFL